MKGEENMKTMAFLSMAFLVAAAQAGQPVVTIDKVEQKGKWVTVSYTLAGDRGIVTPSLLKDGQPVGDDKMVTFEGDICKLVEPGAHSFRWNARQDWPNQRIDDATVRLTAWSELNPPDYLVFDLETEKTVNYYTSTNALPARGLANDIYRTTKVVMRKIPVTGDGKLVHNLKSHNAHRTLFTRDFYMAIYPATQQQYALMAKDYSSESKWPSWFTNAADRATRPAERVSYEILRNMPKKTYAATDKMSRDEISGTCLLAKVRAFTGLMVDIPTPDEWEYACRAGTTGDYYYDDPGTGANFRLGRVKQNGGWRDLSVDPNNDAAEKEAARNWPATWGTAKVGSYPPNPWGLYDMIGNVWEWTVGFVHYYGVSPTVAVDPVGEEAGADQYVFVVGGRWYADPQAVASLHGESGSAMDTGNMYKGGVRLVAPVGNIW